MARFRNSNRHAAAQMAYTAPKANRDLPLEPIDYPCFRRIVFDFARV